MRHQGVMEAQVFYALGARPQWDEGGRVVGVELLSAEELQRPRLDVVLSVTGSYRDQFPAVMQWVDAAVNRTAALSEADNRVAASVERLRKQLESEGIAADRAARLATRRVFSNEPGVYGTGVSDYVNASDLWEQQTRSGGDAEMAKLFLDRMGFPVGEEAGSADAAGLFARHAAGVDCVLASRSSHTFGVLTSDDPFAYIGAFSLAARSLGGKAPRLYVENLRDESEVIIDPADQAIAKEMQSRYLHPQWIKSQQGEGYSGALQVLKTTQFLWGWQVTAPETVRQDQWQSLFDVYLRDQYQLGTQQWLEETNPAALAQMLERMVDAVRLGYWKPDAQTETELLARFDRAMEQSPLRDRNAAVLAFAENRRTRLVDLKPDASATPENSVAAESPPAAAMAANPSSASSPAPPAKPTAASASPQNAAESGFVQGVKMEPEPEPTAPAAPPVVLPGWWETWGVRLGLLAMVFGLVLAGAWRQGGRFR
ncbi:MAG TPA: cobaltochelatase subunit CobN, partial [Pirellulales bacterium]